MKLTIYKYHLLDLSLHKWAGIDSKIFMVNEKVRASKVLPQTRDNRTSNGPSFKEIPYEFGNVWFLGLSLWANELG